MSGHRPSTATAATDSRTVTARRPSRGRRRAGGAGHGAGQKTRPARTRATHPSASQPAARLTEAADQLEAAVSAIGTDTRDWYTGDPDLDFGSEQVPAADCRLIALMSPAAVSRLIPLLRTEAEKADRLDDLYLASRDLDWLRFAEEATAS